MSSFSAFSSVATESRTIAPPAPTLILSPALTMERITIFKSAVPSKPRYPIAPEYTPRGPASRASMMLNVRSLGAPVIEPPGKVARSTSMRSTSRRNVPTTVLTSWWTVLKDSTPMSTGTSTEPTLQTRPRSLRSRSTIIRFSARVFGSVRKSQLRRRSSAGSSDLAIVPLMGLLDTVPSCSTLRNLSGEEDSTSSSSPKAPNLR